LRWFIPVPATILIVLFMINSGMIGVLTGYFTLA
jgi:hypothetical protein